MSVELLDSFFFGSVELLDGREKMMWTVKSEKRGC